jgi:tetratricopeptide (TPR) repeat protein
MKGKMLLPVVLFINLLATGQTFTMGKKCKEVNDQGTALLKEKKYQEALDVFTGMTKSCTTKDGKEASSVGKAEALNGLGKYDEAIAAASVALKVTKNKSLMGLFQTGVAQAKLKQFDAANSSFSQMIALTEKNQDTKTRAQNYALMGLLQWRQLGNKDSANYYLDKAIALDAGNPNFYVQKGDMLADEKKYDDAFAQYDKAVSMGKTDMEMYEIRTGARLKMVQEKYKTTDAQELRSKMSPAEKEQVCTELKKAQSLGMQEMKLDMFSSLVCK